MTHVCIFATLFEFSSTPCQENIKVKIPEKIMAQMTPIRSVSNQKVSLSRESYKGNSKTNTSCFLKYRKKALISWVYNDIIISNFWFSANSVVFFEIRPLGKKQKLHPIWPIFKVRAVYYHPSPYSCKVNLI